jgi:hypothetical protein
VLCVSRLRRTPAAGELYVKPSPGCPLPIRDLLSRLGILIGCGTVAAGVVALMVVATGRAFPLVVGAAFLVLLIVDGLRRWRRASILRLFRARYSRSGRDLLIAYTDSPHWQPYIEERWLPQWGERAVLLNRSRPWDKGSPEARLWEAFKGLEEHTPLAIVVPPRGPVRIVRFFAAFREYKHGKEQRLRAAEHELELALAGPVHRDG